MRGKVDETISIYIDEGITPAYAGKSRSIYEVGIPYQDHPRLCGEKYLYESEHCLPRGSPPPMRGKGLEIEIAGVPHGITPAYAGKRQKGKLFVFCLQDHPRLCGEKRCC